jgi:hypothetical protein
MPRKPKTPQGMDKENVSERDLFQTPNYATDLIVPFLQGIGVKRIWEPAAGLGKMSSRLTYWGFDVYSTDLSYENRFNFLFDHATWYGGGIDAIVTNPPFSLKSEFYEKCLEYGIPLALLIPADYTGWTIAAVQYGAEKVIPNRRIDFITPRILDRIHEGEVWDNIVRNNPKYNKFSIEKMKDFSLQFMSLWDVFLNKTFKDEYRYDSIYDAPQSLLRKYSSSYYHSMWLTHGLKIGQTETFVNLSNEEKNNI